MNEKNLKCPVCNSKNIIIKYREGKEKPSLEIGYARAGVISELYKCKGCGVKFTNVLINFDKNIYASGNDVIYKRSERARKLTFKKDIENLLKKFRGAKGGILDVGCGPGYFLEIVKEKGFKADGIDLSTADCAEANSKGLNVYCTDFMNFCEKNKDKKYDLITMWDFIEHVENPQEVMVNCHNILNIDGKLVISTPDAGSLFAKIMGRRWWNLLSMHLLYFNKRSIKYLLENNGFRVLDIGSYSRILNIKHGLNWLNRYPGLFKIAEFFIALLGIDKLNLPLNFFDSMIVYAEKKEPLSKQGHLAL
ncbi:MAG: class I SAM-dependent methyltransferase [Pseudomonadota bacterium]